MNKESTEQAAREFIKANFFWLNDETQNTAIQPAIWFAEQQVAERARQIADELERITNGTSCEVNRLIAELRGGEWE